MENKINVSITNPDGTETILYTPTPKGLEYHLRTEPNVLLWGGRGSGKSTIGRWDAHLRALTHPGFSYIILRRTYPELQKSHLIHIPREMRLLGGTFHYTDRVATYPNGSKGFFSHCATDDDVLNLLSAEFGLAFFDELSTFSWESFTKLSASVRVPVGSGLTAMVRAATNPLGPSAQKVLEYFVDKTVDLEEDPDYNPEDWYSIHANLEDNPHLDQVQYRKRFSGLPSHVRKAWVDGEFVLENALFDFQPKRLGRPYHVTHDIDLPKILKSATIYRTIDAGWFPDPTVVLWIAHLGNRHLVFNEKIWYKTTAIEIAQDILEEDKRLGIGKVSMSYCLPLDAPIWMGDYSFKPLSSINVGDEVIGTCNKRFPDMPKGNLRKGSNRRKNRVEDRLRKVKVTAIHRTKQEVVKITLESGRVIYCTLDHRWLSGTSYSYKKGKRYIIPKIGTKLVHVVDNPGACPDEKKAAWLGGIYDGEGCRNYIAQSKDHNPETYKQIYDYLKDLGFDAKPVYKKYDGGTYESGVRFNGGFDAAVKFSNWIPSVRFNKSSERYLLISKYKTPDKVVNVESSSIQDVGCLTTESGDFIAYGYVTSNCDPSMDINTTADIRTVKEIYEAHGIPMECSVNKRDMFATVMHNALSEEAGEDIPRIQFYVNGREGCPYLVRTIPQMRYDAKRPKFMDDHKDDHAVVACCYYLLSHSADSKTPFNSGSPIRPWMKPKVEKRRYLGEDNVRDR